MKNLIIAITLSLLGSPLLAQDVCSAVEELIENAPSDFTACTGEQIDEAKSKSTLEFPGAYQCNIETDADKKVFKAYFAESNDKHSLSEKYETVAKDLRKCLGRKYSVEEKLQDDETGKMMVIRKKRGKYSNVLVYLEFSKADLAHASYYLRLTAHEEVQ